MTLNKFCVLCLIASAFLFVAAVGNILAYCAETQC